MRTMAEYLHEDDVRNYQLSDGTHVDLYEMAYTIPVPSIAVGAWVTPRSIGDLSVGQMASVYRMGRYRVGVVTKIGRTNITVTFTTHGAIMNSGRKHGIRVQNSSVKFDTVTVPPAPQPVEIEEEAAPAPQPVETEEESLPAPQPVETEEEALPAPQPVETEEEALPAPQPVETEEEALPATGSSVVTMLERIWNKIREEHSELPGIVMVTGSGLVGPPRWGHFRAGGWTGSADTNLQLGEMFIAGETLSRGPLETLVTILHEATHVLAAVRGIKDTSRQGRWHNQRFLSIAQELGLEYAKDKADPKIGYSEVTLSPGTQEDYQELVDELEIVISVSLPEHLETGQDGGLRKPRTRSSESTGSLIRATCSCLEPRIIRLSRKVLDGPEIMCADCGDAFCDRG
jgi:hypothetical protein